MKLEAQNPLLKARFEEAKEELKDLVVSESRYLELKAIPEAQRTLKDIILLRAFEMQKVIMDIIPSRSRYTRTKRNI